MVDGAVGFVGLGRMGQPMAARIADAGRAVVGYDAAGTDGRLPAEARGAVSLREVAAACETVFLSLPNGAASREVCETLAAAPNGRLEVVVDLSTIGIPSARACAERLGQVGVGYVDAPVSGGVAGARSGGLSMMVGAPAVLFERVKPLLDVVARSCFRVGDQPGQGQAMKLLNNYVSAAALAATAEATVFGARLGLDPAQMVDVLNVSSGRSVASTDKWPRAVLPRTYDFGFAAALMTKDVSLYRESAREAGVPHELADAIAELWTEFNTACPGTDFTYIHRFLEEQAGGV